MQDRNNLLPAARGKSCRRTVLRLRRSQENYMACIECGCLTGEPKALARRRDVRRDANRMGYSIRRANQPACRDRLAGCVCRRLYTFYGRAVEQLEIQHGPFAMVVRINHPRLPIGSIALGGIKVNRHSSYGKRVANVSDQGRYDKTSSQISAAGTLGVRVLRMEQKGG